MIIPADRDFSSMTRSPDWTEEEIIIAMSLYEKLNNNPLKILHISPSTAGVNETSLTLSGREDGYRRKPSSVASKISNLARFDPRVTALGNVRRNGNRLDEKVWFEYHDSDGNIKKNELEQRVRGILDRSGQFIEEGEEDLENNNLAGGFDLILPRKVRQNQDLFRAAVLKNYDGKCCVTRINEAKLLVASHIKPWKDATETEKTDPCNGLCLNGLHDRAFDQGLMTVHPDYTIELSSRLQREIPEPVFRKYFEKIDGNQITLPLTAGIPKKKYLEYHNEKIFITE